MPIDLVGSGHVCFFFFQAEDGIRDDLVTGVQTCALPISATAVPERAPGTRARQSLRHLKESVFGFEVLECDEAGQPTLIKRFGMKKEKIGRASCRERV